MLCNYNVNLNDDIIIVTIIIHNAYTKYIHNRIMRNGHKSHILLFTFQLILFRETFKRNISFLKYMFSRR